MRPTPALGSCDLCGDLILCGFCGHSQLSDEQRSAWEKGVILLLSVILFPVAIVCATSPCTTWSETSPPIHMSWHLPHSLLLLLKDKTHFVGISGYSSVSLWWISLVAQFGKGSQAGKESACNAGDPGSIPGLGRSPGEGNGYPL